MMTRALPLVLCAAALVPWGVSACRRAAGDPSQGDEARAALTPEPGQPTRAMGRRIRSGAPTSLPLGAAAAGERPAPSDPRAPAKVEDPARPAPQDKLSTDPRDKRPELEADSGGKVGFLRLDMPTPPALELSSPGVEPRSTLRYRLGEGDVAVWEARVSQRTELRTEKACTPLDRPGGSSVPPLQTLPLHFAVQLASQVSTALPDRFTLETRFRKVRLTLPPGLADQSELITSLMLDASYQVTMTRTGRVQSFLLGKLSGVGMRSLLERLRTPLGMVQPVLPEPAVGIGASWRQRHQLVVPQAGGKVDALYVTTYRLLALSGEGAAPSAQLGFSTTVRLEGQVMGEAFRGQGSGKGRVALDTRRGLLRSATGEMTICTSVMGRTSTSSTQYSQVLLDAESTLGKGKAAGALAPARPQPERPSTDAVPPSRTAAPDATPGSPSTPAHR